jgi:hypothetical protein
MAAPKYGLKPRKPVINWENPVTNGLVFDAPLFERGGTVANDLAGSLKGSITASGATWETNLYGADLAFSAAASNVAYTVPVGGKLESLTSMSYEALVYSTGLGGGSLGRIFEKGNTNGYFLCYMESSTLLQIFSGFTTDGAWNIPFTENVWNHVVLTYNNSSVSNVPVAYINGELVTVTQSQAPVAPLLADDATFNIGNNSGGTRNWNGKIAYVRAWNRILVPSEVTTLAANPWSIYKQSSTLLQ